MSKEPQHLNHRKIMSSPELDRFQLVLVMSMAQPPAVVVTNSLSRFAGVEDVYTFIAGAFDKGTLEPQTVTTLAQAYDLYYDSSRASAHFSMLAAALGSCTEVHVLRLEVASANLELCYEFS